MLYTELVLHAGTFGATPVYPAVGLLCSLHLHVSCMFGYYAVSMGFSKVPKLSTSVRALLPSGYHTDHFGQRPPHSTLNRQRSTFSGRLLSLSCSSVTLRKSFVPRAIQLFNATQSPSSHITLLFRLSKHTHTHTLSTPAAQDHFPPGHRHCQNHCTLYNRVRPFPVSGNTLCEYVLPVCMYM